MGVVRLQAGRRRRRYRGENPIPQGSFARNPSLVAKQDNGAQLGLPRASSFQGGRGRKRHSAHAQSLIALLLVPSHSRTTFFSAVSEESALQGLKAWRAHSAPGLPVATFLLGGRRTQSGVRWLGLVMGQSVFFAPVRFLSDVPRGVGGRPEAETGLAATPMGGGRCRRVNCSHRHKW